MKSPAKHSRIGPYSRAIDRGAVGWSIDGRSREGRFLRAYEAMLIAHVGGSPSAVQRALIGRAAKLALHCELMDEKALTAGGMGERDARQYVCWSNALARSLSALGIKSASAAPERLADVLASRRRSAA
jgi:hypothetical protein